MAKVRTKIGSDENHARHRYNKQRFGNRKAYRRAVKRLRSLVWGYRNQRRAA